MAQNPGITLGHIDTPEGWNATAHLELTEAPQGGPAVPLAAKAETEQPGANIVVTREETDDATAHDVLEGHLMSLAVSAQGFSRLKDAPVTFSDGRTGVLTIIVFAVGGYRAAQCHLCRVDKGVATHITISTAERNKARLDGDLLRIALSFRP